MKFSLLVIYKLNVFYWIFPSVSPRAPVGSEARTQGPPDVSPARRPSGLSQRRRDEPEVQRKSGNGTWWDTRNEFGQYWTKLKYLSSYIDWWRFFLASSLIMQEDGNLIQLELSYGIGPAFGHRGLGNIAPARLIWLGLVRFGSA